MSHHSERAAKNRRLPTEVYCTGKDAFDSKTLADRVANRTRRRKSGFPASSYRCCNCGSWHVGNQTRPSEAIRKHQRQKERS